MDEADLRLDGNAAAGLLREIFLHDVTVAVTTCAACGAIGHVGSLHVYVHAPGTVVRCPRCGAVLLRVMRSNGRYWFEMSGVRSLELRVD